MKLQQRNGWGSEYVLSNGRTFPANGGLLSPGDDGSLYEGYDGPVWHADWDDAEPFTDAERAEIADFMITKWQRWKAHR